MKLKVTKPSAWGEDREEYIEINEDDIVSEPDDIYRKETFFDFVLKLSGNIGIGLLIGHFINASLNGVDNDADVAYKDEIVEEIVIRQDVSDRKITCE